MGGGGGIVEGAESFRRATEIQRSWFMSYMETNLVVDPFMAGKEIIVHQGNYSKLKPRIMY